MTRPLEEEIQDQLEEIERLIKTLRDDAGRKGVKGDMIQLADGSMPLIPLMAARATCLNALAVLR